MKILLLLFCFLFSFAVNKSYSQSKVDCSKAGSQLEINICAENEFIEADKELNNIYKKVMAKSDDEMKTSLVKSQREWITFRDDYSRIYSLLFKGGSIEASAVLNCKTQTTQARISELKTLYDKLGL